MSPVVQALPSAQALVLLMWAQPVARSHESSVHGLSSSQFITVPLQMPPLHVSPAVQGLSSAHSAPSGRLETTHAPVPGSHAPTRHATPTGA